jgi:hypothetical protein
MVEFGVIAAILLGTAGVHTVFGRRERASLDRHERALDALRDIAAHPRAMPPEPPAPTTEHVHVLDAPPEGALTRRRRTSRTAAARRAPDRRRPRDLGDRPVAAQLPSTPAALDHPSSPQFEPRPDPAPAPAPAPVVPAVRPRTRPRPVVTAAAAACVVLVALVAGAVVAGRDGGEPDASRTPVTAPPAHTPPTTAAAPAPVAPAMQLVTSAGGNGTVTVAVPFTLTLATTDDRSWVRVEDANGETVFEGILEAGATREISAVGPLVVRIGNTPALRLTVNGAALSLAGVAQTANVEFVPPA